MALLKTSSDFPVTTTANPFKYHTVESAKLMESTLASLEANGIDTDFLGERGDDARFILRGRPAPFDVRQIPRPPPTRGYCDGRPHGDDPADGGIFGHSQQQ